MSKFFKSYGVSIALGILFLATWEIVTRLELLNPIIFPRLQAIANVFIYDTPMLLEGLWASLKLLVPALAASATLGVVGGVFVGLNDRVRRVLMPYIHLLSPLPPTLFVPYAIAVLPTFQTASIFLIFLGTFWPIFLGSLQGVLLVDQRFLDNAKTLRLERSDFISKVILPAASPHILSGMSSALIMSFLILTMAEMFGAESGLGYFIQYYSDFAKYDYVIAGMLFNSAIILFALLLFERMRRKLLFWTSLKSDGM